MRYLILLSILFPTVFVYGQDTVTTRKDTITLLSEVVVHGYANDRPLSEVPAAIGYVDTKVLERFNNTSILPAVNTIPGVRMEERSPGSYRFAIRGSSLRSPFGVRNVKMYWNGLPLTDGGGNTYLNLIDFSSISNAEIIKGPGASLYGAGSGGVVLLSSPSRNIQQVQFSALAGSYGLQRYQAGIQTGSEKASLNLSLSHQQADGYRQQTNMRRDAINTDLRFRLGNSTTLSATLFYTDLYYQTPGGLKKAQYDKDPRQARPTESSPGAVAQQAAIYNKTLYSGLMLDHTWSDHWSSRMGTYGSITDFTNPALRNYETRKEYNIGARTETQYRFSKGAWSGKITGGAEYQHFYSTLADYGNRLGVKDTLQTNDHLTADQLLLFIQGEIDLPSNFYLTIGGSANFLNYAFSRVSVQPSVDQRRTFNPVVSPRVALLKKITDQFSAYGSISQGFSPPSLAEVRPSTGNYNNTLNPEHGTNYELGLRGTVWNQLSLDVAAYDFLLKQTIVVQQQNGADYFINAGSTNQKGLELMVSWSPLLDKWKTPSPLRLWNSYTYNHYRFTDYKPNALDYSGNKLTGVAPNIWVGGVDVRFAKKFYTQLTLNYVDKIPMNDGNTEFSPAYFLAGMRAGYKGMTRSGLLELFAGVDNATDQRYSLGNDLNASGGRYYNAAARRNFYAGIKLNVTGNASGAR